MERLLKDEIKSRFSTNIVQSRKFSELLVDSLAKYRNRAIETAQVIEELIAMAKQFNVSFRETDLTVESLCPFGRMASAQVLLVPTPFCQRDTIIVTLEKPAHHSRLRRNILCNIRHIVNYVTQSGGIKN